MHKHWSCPLSDEMIGGIDQHELSIMGKPVRINRDSRQLNSRTGF
jgi:hypothetical protein